jgi:hypothetical protein
MRGVAAPARGAGLLFVHAPLSIGYSSPPPSSSLRLSTRWWRAPGSPPPPVTCRGRVQAAGTMCTMSLGWLGALAVGAIERTVGIPEVSALCVQHDCSLRAHTSQRATVCSVRSETAPSRVRRHRPTLLPKPQFAPRQRLARQSLLAPASRGQARKLGLGDDHLAAKRRSRPAAPPGPPRGRCARRPPCSPRPSGLSRRRRTGVRACRAAARRS